MAYPVSAAFMLALNASHRIGVRAYIYESDGITPVAELLPGDAQRLYDGQVSVDYANGPRRTSSLSIVDYEGDFTPTDSSSPIWYSRLIKIDFGFRDLSTGEEWVPLGVFRANTIKVTTNNSYRILTITGDDMRSKVERARFTDTYTVAAGTNVATAIQDILTQAGISRFNFIPTTAVTRQLTYARADDRWQAVNNIANGAGLEVYFDRAGVCVLREIPDPTKTSPAWKYDAVNLPVLGVVRTITDDQLYNHVVVSGESSDAVVRADASNTDPSSPTSIPNIGDIPYFQVVASTTAQADAQALADALLPQVQRVSDVTQVKTTPNPALDPLDVIYVKDAFSKTDANYVVESFIISFQRGESMTITSRKMNV